MNYAELRAANAQAYCRQNATFFGLVPTWGPLWNCAGQMGDGADPQALFNRIHDAAIRAIAAQQTEVDWTQTYAAVKPLLEAEPLLTAIQSARWDLATRVAAHGESPQLTKELLARHIREAFARTGLTSASSVEPPHRTQIRRESSQTTAIDPSTLLATIITAVLGVVCPPTAAFSALLEPIIAVILKVLFSSLTTQFTNGTYGASADTFNTQVQEWAQEAAAS